MVPANIKPIIAELSRNERVFRQENKNLLISYVLF